MVDFFATNLNGVKHAALSLTSIFSGIYGKILKWQPKGFFDFCQEKLPTLTVLSDPLDTDTSPAFPHLPTVRRIGFLPEFSLWIPFTTKEVKHGESRPSPLKFTSSEEISDGTAESSIKAWTSVL